MTVLTDAGFGMAFSDGRPVYGDLEDPLLAPDGVRVWLSVGGRRLYATAMPDYARAEQAFLQGERRGSIDGHTAVYTVTDGDWRFQMEADVYGGGERRRLRLYNTGLTMREAVVCAAVTPAFSERETVLPGGRLREGQNVRLALWAEPADVTCRLTGGARLRVRWRVVLPPGAHWEGTVYLTGGERPGGGNRRVRLLEPWLPPEPEQLVARLSAGKAAAYTCSAGEMTENSTAIQPPHTPYFHLAMSGERHLPVLRAGLSRLSRWKREGIPTGLWVICPPPLQAQVGEICRGYPSVPCTVTADEPPLWRALSCGYIGRGERRGRVAVPYTPLPVTAPPGESLRRVRLAPSFSGVRPGSWRLFLLGKNRLYSLLEAQRGKVYALPWADGAIRLTVRRQETADCCRFTVTLDNGTPHPLETALTLYTEPQLHTAQDRPLTGSSWDPADGTLCMTHPLVPGRRLWLSAGAGAEFDCDRAALFTGDWGGRRVCPLRFPGAGVTRRLRLAPSERADVAFEAGWAEPPPGTFG